MKIGDKVKDQWGNTGVVLSVYQPGVVIVQWDHARIRYGVRLGEKSTEFIRDLN